MSFDMHIVRKIAEKYDCNPEDEEAITRFLTSTLPRFQPDVRDRIEGIMLTVGDMSPTDIDQKFDSLWEETFPRLQ